ncbi:MAG: hypothetical protein IPH82_26880 [Chloroflexi bacterium]|nr:hypothetical protein [Chloroflexota bacterium]
MRVSQPALRAANVRLNLALPNRRPQTWARGQVQAARESTPPAIAPPALELPNERPADRSGLAGLVAALPPHLGWESTAVTAHLRQLSTINGQLLIANGGEAATAGNLAQPEANDNSLPDQLLASAADGDGAADYRQPEGQRPSVITMHPSLALALLQQERVAEGRLWLLLRALDEHGRGWWQRREITAVLTGSATAVLTGETSHPPLCTPRYLRQLLAQGEGLFWRQDEAGKVWLRGQAKVAADLGLRRLRGRAVSLPLDILYRPIGELRAHLYASFHSGRGAEAGPISRETLRDLSGASPRTQQTYERKARVRVQPCLAVGEPATAANLQEHAWQHGRAAFTFTDPLGQRGRPGRSYQARRLPNCYHGPHPTGSRPRRLNRQLAGLCHQGDAGNGRLDGWVNGRWAERRYYTAGATAVQGWTGGGGQTWVYWPERQRSGGVLLWHALPPNQH